MITNYELHRLYIDVRIIFEIICAKLWTHFKVSK